MVNHGSVCNGSNDHASIYYYYITNKQKILHLIKKTFTIKKKDFDDFCRIRNMNRGVL